MINYNIWIIIEIYATIVAHGSYVIIAYIDCAYMFMLTDDIDDEDEVIPGTPRPHKKQMDTNKIKKTEASKWKTH